MRKFSAEAKRHSLKTMATVALAASLASVVVTGFMPSTLAASFNNVQVFVSTSDDLPYSYFFSAYNVSGFLVVSYQSSYPAAGFELPTGEYLFAVSATYQKYDCRICMDAGVNPPSSGASTGSSSGSSTTPGSPIAYFQPAAEYGYRVVQVSSPVTLDISTQNVTKVPTMDLTVHVAYINGTAAAGSQVSASVIGQWYYWGGPDSVLSMYGQTDKNGMATLIVPKAPAVVTAWSWVPVNTAKNRSTIETNVGGEMINVNVYWQPTYVGLSGSGLVIPPTNSLSLTLHYQEPNYWVMPLGVEAKGASGIAGGNGTLASEPTGVPSGSTYQSNQEGASGRFYIPTKIPRIQGPGGTDLTAGQPAFFGGMSLTTLAAVSGLLVAGALVAMFYVSRRSRKGSSAQAE